MHCALQFNTLFVFTQHLVWAQGKKRFCNHVVWCIHFWICSGSPPSLCRLCKMLYYKHWHLLGKTLFCSSFKKKKICCQDFFKNWNFKFSEKKILLFINSSFWRQIFEKKCKFFNILPIHTPQGHGQFINNWINKHQLFFFIHCSN